MKQPLVLAAIECAPLVPQSYREKLQGVGPLPQGATIGTLADRLDEQTSNLDRANGRTSDVIGLIDACDKRNKGIIRELVPEKQWYEIWK